MLFLVREAGILTPKCLYFLCMHFTVNVFISNQILSPGLDTVDYTLYPDKAFQLKWLREYLIGWHEVNGNKEPVTDKEVEILYAKANKFALVSHT